MRDNNNVVLGDFVSLSRQTVTVRTSTGHYVSINLDGTFSPSQIYYTGAGCTGTAYLNTGGFTAKMYGKTVVWSGSFNAFMVPATVDANGVSTSVDFTAATIDNPTCGGSAGSRNGWQLVSRTRAQIGLPATIALPISL